VRKKRLHRRLEPNRLLESGARLGWFSPQRRERIGVERKTTHRRGAQNPRSAGLRRLLRQPSRYATSLASRFGAMSR
jgi:hypothetical protein